MQTLRTVLLVFFVLDSALLVIAILIQSGRGGGLAGALGGISGADSALGVRAASQIEKVTGLLAGIFMALAIGLAFVPIERAPDLEPGREQRAGTSSEPAGAESSAAEGGATSAAGSAAEARDTTPVAEPADTTPAAQPAPAVERGEGAVERGEGAVERGEGAADEPQE